jgi:hypothetical protein
MRKGKIAWRFVEDEKFYHKIEDNILLHRTNGDEVWHLSSIELSDMEAEWHILEPKWVDIDWKEALDFKGKLRFKLSSDEWIIPSWTIGDLSVNTAREYEWQALKEEV